MNASVLMASIYHIHKKKAKWKKKIIINWKIDTFCHFWICKFQIANWNCVWSYFFILCQLDRYSQVDLHTNANISWIVVFGSFQIPLANCRAIEQKFFRTWTERSFGGSEKNFKITPYQYVALYTNFMNNTENHQRSCSCAALFAKNNKKRTNSKTQWPNKGDDEQLIWLSLAVHHGNDILFSQVIHYGCADYSTKWGTFFC